MMPVLRRIIGIFQIYGGIAGGFATLNSVINTELIGINAVLGYLVLSYYVVAVIAGVLLLECREVGRQVSIVIQALAIPQIFVGLLKYQLVTGAVYLVKVGAENTNYISTDWAVTSQWAISFNSTQAIGFGVNLFALAGFLLLSNKRIIKFK